MQITGVKLQWPRAVTFDKKACTCATSCVLTHKTACPSDTLIPWRDELLPAGRPADRHNWNRPTAGGSTKDTCEMSKRDCRWISMPTAAAAALQRRFNWCFAYLEGLNLQLRAASAMLREFQMVGLNMTWRGDLDLKFNWILGKINYFLPHSAP
jgi:hypothetical protein